MKMVWTQRIIYPARQLICCLWLASLSVACTDADEETAPATVDSFTSEYEQSATYRELQKKILYGEASLFEVRTALTNPDVGSLTNTVHTLYSMKWHRGVYHLLDDLWYLHKSKAPDLDWDKIAKPPVRIAVASTLNRTRTENTNQYRDYIRRHQYDEHEFHRAQVVIALGFNQDPQDIPYLVEMVNADNHYVTQSAITALALMRQDRARDAMIKLLKQHQDNPRGELLKELLAKAYQWRPER